MLLNIKAISFGHLYKIIDTFDDAYKIIIGPSMHTARSDHFPASTYHDVALDKDSDVCD